VLSSPSFTKRGKELAQFAIEHRLPTMFTFKHYVDDRGLVSYGVVFPPM
jgi:hypothetical protein